MTVHYNRLAHELANDNIQYLEDFIVRQGLPKPYIEKDPALGSLPCQRIRYAYQYWKSVSDELGAVPSRAYIRPSGLGIALGNICLLEPLHEGRDYRYRLYGSNIAHYSKHDLQGMTMSEVSHQFPDMLCGDGEFHMAIYQCAQQQARPYYAEFAGQGGRDGAFWLWRRLTLPLADGDGNIIMLMNCLTPHQLTCENGGDQKKSIA